MRILVIGGYGLIGGAVITRLTGHGHMVYGAGRDIAEAQRRFPQVRWVKADLAMPDPAVWGEILNGIDAVVNCAGALQDSHRDHSHAVHVDGLRRLGEAAQAAGVKRIVHVSAAGLEVAPGAFGQTKRAAEAALTGLDIDWVVLRPGLIMASAAFGISALLRALAAFPGFIPVLHAEAKVQVASLYDVADAVAAAVQPGAPKRVAIDLVNAEEVSVAEMLLVWRAWLGAPPAPLVFLPAFLARFTAAVADGLGVLGWRSPMRSTAVAQLAAGVRGDSNASMRQLGVRMRGMSEILALAPSGVQERWFARLYLFKPLCILTLAAFWIASGVIALINRDAAAAALAHSGLPAGLAVGIAWLRPAIGFLLGLLVCWRRTAKLALFGMLWVTLALLVGTALWMPHLWSDPLGPVIKLFPCAVLALAALSILDER